MACSSSSTYKWQNYELSIDMGLFFAYFFSCELVTLQKQLKLS